MLHVQYLSSAVPDVEVRSDWSRLQAFCIAFFEGSAADGWLVTGKDTVITGEFQEKVRYFFNFRTTMAWVALVYLQLLQGWVYVLVNVAEIVQG